MTAIIEIMARRHLLVPVQLKFFSLQFIKSRGVFVRLTCLYSFCCKWKCIWSGCKSDSALNLLLNYNLGASLWLFSKLGNVLAGCFCWHWIAGWIVNQVLCVMLNWWTNVKRLVCGKHLKVCKVYCTKCVMAWLRKGGPEPAGCLTNEKMRNENGFRAIAKCVVWVVCFPSNRTSWDIS